MATAKLVLANAGGHPGVAHVYEMDPPFREANGAEHKHVTVWVQPEFGHQQAEANLVATDERGGSVYPSVRRLVSYTHSWDPTHEGVLFLAGGYQVVSADAEPEVEDAVPAVLASPAAEPEDEVSGR